MGLSQRYRLSDAFPKFYESLNMGHFSKERGESNRVSAQTLGVPGLEQGHLMRPPGHRGLWRVQMRFKLSCCPPCCQKVMCIQYLSPHSRSLFCTAAWCWDLGLGIEVGVVPSRVSPQPAARWGSGLRLRGEVCASRPSPPGWVATPAALLVVDCKKLAPDPSLPLGSALPC